MLALWVKVLVKPAFAFKGVPYAAPTGAASRFMPPQPPEQWASVGDALDCRGHAPQLPALPVRRRELLALASECRVVAGPDRDARLLRGRITARA